MVRNVTVKEIENKELLEHLKDLYDCGIENIHVYSDELSKRKIFNLLLEYSDAFPKDELDLGNTSVNEHKIDTGNAKRVTLPPGRVPLAYAEAELQLIHDMEKQGIIRMSNSP